MENENDNIVQEYEGDEESALATAKRRMAERDAEYKAKFAEFASGKKPSTSTPKALKKSSSNQDYSNEGRSVPEKKELVSDYSNEGRSVPVKKEIPSNSEYSNEGRSVPVAKETKAPEVRQGETYADVNGEGGLRSLRGGNSIPGSDREEFSESWKRFN